VTGVTFFLLAAYVVADASYTLLSATKPDSSTAGVTVSASALLVMPPLSALKRRTGAALASQMLVAVAPASVGQPTPPDYPNAIAATRGTACLR
jgi:divalent metal cation (Fe/Co/Zn/Cd) transporter